MSFQLPKLPYAPNEMSPFLSAETFEYHYGKHHKAYIDKMNAALPQSDLNGKSLEEIVRKSSGGLFNNAAQAWNHSFYWFCLCPKGNQASASLSKAIDGSFGSMNDFKNQFIEAGKNLFGSGWVWLVKNADSKLEIQCTSNADSPVKNDKLTPVLTCDVWEHAYYVDFRNARDKYLTQFWDHINWEYVSGCYDQNRIASVGQSMKA